MKEFANAADLNYDFFREIVRKYRKGLPVKQPPGRPRLLSEECGKEFQSLLTGNEVYHHSSDFLLKKFKKLANSTATGRGV